jgi:hypothetical protein
MEEGFPRPLVSRANPHRTPHVCRRPSSSGSLAIFAAILRASSFVSNFAADRRPSFSSKKKAPTD